MEDEGTIEQLSSLCQHQLAHVHHRTHEPQQLSPPSKWTSLALMSA